MTFIENGITNESKVRQWCMDFKHGRANVHEETHGGRPSLMTEDWSMKSFVKITNSRRLSLQNISS